MIGLIFVTPVTVLTNKGLAIVATDLNVRRQMLIIVAMVTVAIRCRLAIVRRLLLLLRYC